MKYILILYLFHLGEYGPWKIYRDDFESCHKEQHRIEAMFEHGPMDYERVLIRGIFDDGKGRNGILFIPCSIQT